MGSRRDQLAQCVIPSPYSCGLRPDPDTQSVHDEVTAILNAMNVLGSEVSRHTLDRILIENVDDVIHVISFHGDYLFLSPSCKKVLEYDPIELVGKALSTICHPSDIGTVVRELRASTSSAPVSVTYRIRQKYKGYIWFECHGAWHVDPIQGRNYLVMTGRPRPAYSLVQIARLGSLTAFANGDMWAKVTLSGIILFVTSKVKLFLGCNPDDLIGKDIHELMDTFKPNTVTDALEATAKGKGIVFGEKECSSDTKDLSSFRHRMRHKDGHDIFAQTKLYLGDLNQRARPSFLVAHTLFVEPYSSSAVTIAAGDEQEIGAAPCTSQISISTLKHSDPSPRFAALDQRVSDSFTLNGSDTGAPHSSINMEAISWNENEKIDPTPFSSCSFHSHLRPGQRPSIGAHTLPLGSYSAFSPEIHANEFTESNTVRGRSWQTELHDLKIQNDALSTELRSLLERREERKGKRKQTAIPVEKSCATCSTKSTPEWRRGPSGNRDLCNRCGLRWKKLVRSKADAAACAPAVVGSDMRRQW